MGSLCETQASGCEEKEGTLSKTSPKVCVCVGGGQILWMCMGGGVCGSKRMLEGISMVMSAFCDCRGFNKVSFLDFILWN